MIVKRILSKINSEVCDKELKKINETDLPGDFNNWVIEYEEAGGLRKRFLWKMWYGILEKDSFPVLLLSSYEEHNKSAHLVKFLLTMLVVQIDDIADNNLGRDFLNESIKIILNNEHQIYNLNKREKKYVIFTKKIWDFINVQIREYPHYLELEDLFNFDILQIVNTIRYSYLINNNHNLMNQTESWLYYPNNMAFMPASTINLMYSKEFKFNNIGLYREIVYKVQLLGRISNWITTWQREFHKNDFSSSIYAYLISHEILSLDNLRTLPEEQIIKIIKESSVEEYFLQEWENIYVDVKKKAIKIKQIDLKSLLMGQEHLLYIDLISNGYK